MQCFLCEESGGKLIPFTPGKFRNIKKRNINMVILNYKRTALIMFSVTKSGCFEEKN